VLRARDRGLHARPLSRVPLLLHIYVLSSMTITDSIYRFCHMIFFRFLLGW
jgi:hypothetical protein